MNIMPAAKGDTMALLGGLFKKKVCAFCGEEIGLLGNRKLEDGDMCKNCAAKLSPWFDERRHSTVEQIGEQLKYREQNQAAVAAFQITRTIGTSTKVYLDEINKKFMISDASDLQKANPDVIDAGAVTNAALDIKEMKNEIYRKNSEGKSVAYIPARYDYAYDFFVNIDVNHPYFDRMRVKVNNSSIWLRYDDVQARRMGAGRPGMAGGSFSPTGHLNGGGIGAAVLNGLAGAIGINTGDMGSPEVYSPEYQEMLYMAQDIRDSLMTMRAAALGYASQPADQPATQQASEPAQEAPVSESAVAPASETEAPAAAEAPAEQWTCPYCGTINTGNFCTACGAAKT